MFEKQGQFGKERKGKEGNPFIFPTKCIKSLFLLFCLIRAIWYPPKSGFVDLKRRWVHCPCYLNYFPHHTRVGRQQGGPHLIQALSFFFFILLGLAPIVKAYAINLLPLPLTFYQLICFMVFISIPTGLNVGKFNSSECLFPLYSVSKFLSVNKFTNVEVTFI